MGQFLLNSSYQLAQRVCSVGPKVVPNKWVGWNFQSIIHEIQRLGWILFLMFRYSEKATTILFIFDFLFDIKVFFTKMDTLYIVHHLYKVYLFL